MLYRPLLKRHRPGIAIGPATFLRQRNLGLDSHLMPGGGAELDYLQPPAEQLDAVSRLRALIAAVEDAGGKDVGAVMPADGDVLRPQRNAHLLVRAERMQQRHLAPPSLTEIDRAELSVARHQRARKLVGRTGEIGDEQISRA